jgi:hypothetical protein
VGPAYYGPCGDFDPRLDQTLSRDFGACDFNGLNGAKSGDFKATLRP